MSTPNRAIRLKNLRAAPRGAFLYCRKCGEGYSANPSDYFWMREDTVFKCCKVNNRLMTRHTVLLEVP